MLTSAKNVPKKAPKKLAKGAKRGPKSWLKLTCHIHPPPQVINVRELGPTNLDPYTHIYRIYIYIGYIGPTNWDPWYVFQRRGEGENGHKLPPVLSGARELASACVRACV